MNKFKCSKCSHEATEKGFCPKDGAELVETKSSESTDEKLAKFLDQVGSMVQEKTKETIKSMGLENVDKKIFGNGKALSRAEKYEYVKGMLNEVDRGHLESCDNEKEETAFLKKARTAYFFKNLILFHTTKDPEYLLHVKALAEGVDADGGYLTPREFRAELVKDLKDASFLRSLVQVIPMNSDYLELPTLVNDVKVSWGSENTAISTTTAAFGQLTFAPKRLNTLIYVSRELVRDSALNVVSMLTELMTAAIGREEDRVIVNGSGTGQPKGILQETLKGIDNANVDADLATNIKKLPFRLPKAYRRNARWLANSLAVEQISALKDSQNNFLIRNLEGKGLEEATLAGYPIAEQNDLPVDTMIFGDMKFYYLADREQISVETTTEGAGTFEKHQVAIKVVERIDGKVAVTNAFRTLTNCGVD